MTSRKMRSTAIPELDKVKPDTPLRLDVAAALAYPDGSMTASGLRKEAGRGRLVIERTAGKDYTTLAAIARMRELCRHIQGTAPLAAQSPARQARPPNSPCRVAHPRRRASGKHRLRP